MVKFLIIRFSSIGDIVLTTPTIRCMKNQIDDAEIHYLTKATFKSILSANPYLDKIHVLDKNYSNLIKELKKENFDYVIDLHKNIRSYRVKSALKRMSFSFNKLNFKKWLLVNFKINKLPDLHIVDRYLNTANVFSVINDKKGLDFFIPPEEEKQFSKELTELPEKFIVIVTGGGHNTKQIPTDKIQQIINRIDIPCILLGGPEDTGKAEQLTNQDNKNLINLVGKLTINQSASIIRRSLLIVTPDTGLMHIAAAFRIKIISLWGNTIPEFGMYPYLSEKGSKVFEVSDLKCRPCSKIGFSKCPRTHFNCMNLQDYQAIITLIQTSIKN